MIGNDIVDLQAATGESNWNRPGYLHKVFNTEEQQQIQASKDPDLLVWIFWSMKEAAYKAHQRKFSLKRSYAPVKYGCKLHRLNEKSAKGKVNVEGRIYTTQTSISQACIHTVSKASAGIKTFDRTMPSSVDPKNLLLEEISRIWGFPRTFISIEKDMNAVPFMTLQNQMLSYPFSISHHGKFAAFSLSLMKD